MTNTNSFPHPILITGGAGFLGSHMAAFCLEKNIDINETASIIKKFPENNYKYILIKND